MRRAAAAMWVGAALTATVAAQAERANAGDPVLHLVHGEIDPLAGPLPVAPSLAAPRDAQLWVVQVATAPQPAQRAQLARRGEVLGWLPDSAWLVRGSAAAIEPLRALPFVRWLGALPLAWKLPAELHALVARAGDVADSDAADAVAADFHLLLATPRDEAAVVARVRAAGGRVLVHGPVLVRARLTPRQLRALASDDGVLWAEPATAVAVDMNNARSQGGANHVEAVAGLTGQGVRGEITEGLDQAHVDFAGLPYVAHFDGLNQHGHCTAGIVFGRGVSHPDARGMLPDGTLIEADYTLWLPLQTRYQLVQQATDPNGPVRAMFQTASWGDATTASYTAISAELDRAIFDFDLPVTQSMSNFGTSNARPQAWAKNVLAVGALYHFDNATPLDDAWNGGASIGPASDNRIKPDLVGYYDQVCTSAIPAPGYVLAFNGTSAATPIVAGHLGLLLQMFTDGAFGNPLPLPATAPNRFANRPHASTARALLLASTAQYPFASPLDDKARDHQGWGFPDVRTAWEQRAQTLLIDEYVMLQQGDERAQFVWVAPNTPELRATMVHSDPPALPLAAIHRVNRVDLRVERFGTSDVWHGNHGLRNGTVSTQGGAPDDRATVEQVVLANPLPGLYRVVVAAPQVVVDGHVETPQLDVDYALAVRPTGGGYHAGAFALATTSTRPGELVFTCSNAPANGWNEGFTFVSLDTHLPAAFGRFLGLEDDVLFGSVLALPAVPGGLLHFPNVPGQFPFAPFAVAAPIASALSGLQLDALVALLDPNLGIAALSNAARVAIR